MFVHVPPFKHGLLVHAIVATVVGSDVFGIVADCVDVTETTIACAVCK